MILVRLVTYTSFCIALFSEVQGITAPTEDLVDEYYTTILKPNDIFLTQDEKDAQAIVDSNRKEETIASILSYRDKFRRFAIQQRILLKIESSVGTSSNQGSNTTYYWVNEYYPPQRNGNWTDTFLDLCFGLLLDENVVLGQYLDNFFNAKDETWITIGMVLTKDMEAMISTFNENHSAHNFKDERKSQRHPFENMLRVWVRQNREKIETTEPNKEDVKKDAETLKQEYDSGDWHEKKRDQLELILMKKSIKYARAVIAEFETAMGGKKLEDIINDCVHSDINLNHDLADAYASLARYIKDKYSYIAGVLHTYADGSDFWAAWIMCIAVVHPQEWPEVDLAFQEDYKVAGSLSQFILQKLTNDKVMAEMIAVIIDPKFKPTKFPGKPDQGGSMFTPTPSPFASPAIIPAPSPPGCPQYQGGSMPIPTPPPVAPTTTIMAPAPPGSPQ